MGVVVTQPLAVSGILEAHERFELVSRRDSLRASTQSLGLLLEKGFLGLRSHRVYPTAWRLWTACALARVTAPALGERPGSAGVRGAFAPPPRTKVVECA